MSEHFESEPMDYDKMVKLMNTIAGGMGISPHLKGAGEAFRLAAVTDPVRRDTMIKCPYCSTVSEPDESTTCQACNGNLLIEGVV